MLIWKEAYETGNNEVDEQHKKLFEIGNQAFILLKNPLIEDKYDKIVDIIEELKAYTQYHFKSEEEYMMKIRYKGFFAHKLEHDDFIKKFDEIDYSRIDQGQKQYILEILDFISNWITNHILEKDLLHSHKSKQ